MADASAGAGLHEARPAATSTALPGRAQVRVAMMAAMAAVGTSDGGGAKEKPAPVARAVTAVRAGAPADRAGAGASALKIGTGACALRTAASASAARCGRDGDGPSGMARSAGGSGDGEAAEVPAACCAGCPQIPIRDAPHDGAGGLAAGTNQFPPWCANGDPKAEMLVWGAVWSSTQAALQPLSAPCGDGPHGRGGGGVLDGPVEADAAAEGGGAGRPLPLPAGLGAATLDDPATG